MLRATSLRYAYPGAEQSTLDGVDLTLEPGDRILLTGPNGSGKTTLLRLLAGLLPAQTGTLELPTDDKGRLSVGFVPQNPEAWMLAPTVEQEVAFSLENLGMPTGEMKQRVDEALHVMGIEELRHRNPAKLSGGEMQMTLIACLYALRPAVWLLDEPTAFLDPYARARVVRLLERVPAECALVYAAPSEEPFPGVTSRMELRAGRVRATGDGDGSSLEEAPPEQTQRNGVSNALYSGLSETRVSVRAAISALSADRRELFGPAQQVLEDVDLTLESGVTALLGRSGAGKSTLLEVLAGTLKPASGTVSWNGRPPGKLKGQIGYAFQFPERSFFSETVLDEVAWGPHNLGLDRNEAHERAVTALQVVGLDPDRFASRSPFELSRGEARRVALAAVWSLRPLAWLVDEPTAGLDDAGCETIGAMLKAEAERGCIVVIAGHDTARFARWANRLLLLERGRLIVDGTPAEWWGNDTDAPWPAPGAMPELSVPHEHGTVTDTEVRTS